MSIYEKDVAMTENRRESRPAMRKQIALVMGICVSLVLLSSLLAMPTLAGTWYSESNYAYFAGDIVSWDKDPSFHPPHGLNNWIVGYASNFTNGDDPAFEVFLFDLTDIGSYPGGSTQCYLESFDICCDMGGAGGSVSTVKLNNDRKDLYASGMWEIRGTKCLLNANATNIEYYTVGFSISTIVVVMTSTNAGEGYAREMKAFADNANVTDIEFYVVGVNCTGNFAWPNCDILAEYDGVVDRNGEPRSSFVQISQKGYDAPGEIYVTGDWTDITMNIQSVGTLLGKVNSWRTSGNETDPSDPDSTPEVKADPRADLNDDHRIDILDIFSVAVAFGSNRGSPKYEPRLDINSDDIINILDIFIVAKSFGKTY